jgi:hypothetical protein
MDPDAGPDRLSFLAGQVPPGFQLRVATIAPGRQRASRADEWRDALVVVERGQVEVECLGGSRHRFGCGDLLCLSGLPLRALHNPGSEPAVLVAVTRRTDEFSAGPPSQQ